MLGKLESRTFVTEMFCSSLLFPWQVDSDLVPFQPRYCYGLVESEHFLKFSSKFPIFCKSRVEYSVNGLITTVSR